MQSKIARVYYSAFGERKRGDVAYSHCHSYGRTFVGVDMKDAAEHAETGSSWYELAGLLLLLLHATAISNVLLDTKKL